ncbi:acetyl esterase/lipase [Saccharothrix coeruleofusca]|nr:alpha/beta hydrolase fold domain-containing protein [Saccharothrix coeruleofusca]MBP2334871.1 acetyl esterase/lipase [Saccharothrix coeruleofusca]
MLFFHGGGYVLSHIDLFDGPVARYVSASGVPMLSVEYRRTPEHPFPTPLRDAYAALRWRSSPASAVGPGSPGRSSSCRCSTTAPPPPTRTSRPTRCGPTTTTAPRGPPCSATPQAGSTCPPARLEDASGLPPAYIEVGQLDVFRDEDTAYATKLSRAGVPVEFHLHPGAPHEFGSIAFESDLARRAMADRVRVLKSIWARAGSRTVTVIGAAAVSGPEAAFGSRAGRSQSDGSASRTPGRIASTSMRTSWSTPTPHVSFDR